MAEPIGIASGLVALTAFAFQSSLSLYRVVESFQSNKKIIRELKEELEALNEVLQSLQQTTASNVTDLPALELPLFRCGQACKEFEALILKCTAHSGGSRTSFRDWAKLKYMGDDVVGFKNMLARYKSTISIGLGDANFRRAAVTVDVLKDYREMITNTTSDLDERLQEIEKILQELPLRGATIPDEDTAMRERMQEEKDSTKHCLAICAQTSEQIYQLQPNVFEDISTDKDSHQVKVTTLGGLVSAKGVTANILEKFQKKLTNTTSDLEEHLQRIDNRLQAFSSAKNLSEIITERKRVQEEREGIKQCLAICTQAFEKAHQIRTNVFEDTSVAKDANQLIFSTLGDLVEAKRLTAGLGPTQWLGQLSAATLQQVSRDRGIEFRKRVQEEKDEDAEAINRQMLDLRERVLGKGSTHTLTSMDNMTSVLRLQGEMMETEEMHRHALAAKEKVDASSPEENFELASVASLDVPSLFSGSTLSSNDLIEKLMETAKQFAEVLFTDSILQPLYEAALKRVDHEKFERNFSRLLTQYAVDLKKEASNPLEADAAKLIRKYARYVASCLRKRLDPNESEKYERFDRLSLQEPDKKFVEDFVLHSEAIQVFDDKNWRDDQNDHSDQDESDSDHSDGNTSSQSYLKDFRQVENFMTEAKAFLRLRENFRIFVLPVAEIKTSPKVGRTQMSGSSLTLRGISEMMKSTAKSCFRLFIFPDLKNPIAELKNERIASSYTTSWERLRVKVSEFSFVVRLLFRPSLSPGYLRITWICGCGDYMYTDIQESQRDGAAYLQDALRKSAAATREHADGHTNVLPSLPAQVHLASSTVPSISPSSLNAPSRPQNTSGSPRSKVNTASASSGISNQPFPQDNKFLLLCISTSHTATLEHLDVSGLQNDEYLFDKIQEAYYQAGGNDAWYMRTPFTRFMFSKVGWLTQFVSTLNFDSPKTMDFVRFRLVPVGLTVQPWHFSSPSLPPEPEVKVKKSYHYHPCPQDDVDLTCLRGAMLHSLLKPGPHLDEFWLNRFPKKLREGLIYRSGLADGNAGWGIHIVHGPNAVLIVWLGLVVTTTSGLLGIAYSVVRKDPGSGFGMASWIVALLALAIAYLQLKPRM